MSIESSFFQTDAKCPLDDVRILDLTRFVSGNQFSLVLADLGAEVIKIENPDSGDLLRLAYEKGIYWKVYARNKKSITLNFKHPKAKELLLDLVENAHVLAENFVPGTMEKFGLSPEILLKRNPKLIILRISGWGQTGPFAKRPGFGTLAEAMSGFVNQNGYEDRPPLTAPMSLADMVAGLYAAVATLSALHHCQENDGKGQVVDISLFDPLFSIMGPDAALLKIGKQRKRGGGTVVSSVRGVYGTKDGGYVSMSAATPNMVDRFFKAIGREDLLENPKFNTPVKRIENKKEVDAIVGEFYSSLTLDECIAFIDENRLTAAPVYDITQIINDPFVQDRKSIVEMPDAESELDCVPMHNVVPRLSATPGAIRRPAPKLGEHNIEIFGEIGLSGDNLDKLRIEGVI